jgi:hypothetical protein
MGGDCAGDQMRFAWFHVTQPHLVYVLSPPHFGSLSTNSLHVVNEE